jgi:predicted TIM-barrel fold metal-dependent hydrolase
MIRPSRRRRRTGRRGGPATVRGHTDSAARWGTIQLHVSRHVQGVEVAVLSLASPGVQNLATADAVAVAREANDALAEIVAGNPERFQVCAAIRYVDAADDQDE